MLHEHTFIPSDKFKDYEVCTECGTYHSTALMDRKELYENEYWSEEHGHSFWGDQINNLTLEEINGFSKVDKVLSYVKKPGIALEIGCAPGVVMNRLRRKGHTIYGVEPDATLIPEIVKVAQCEPEKIIHGYFPEVKLPAKKFDHILAIDIVEHIEDYETFIWCCKELLNHDGKFIMMSPMIRNGIFRERDLCAHEHAWIWDHKYFADFLCTIFQEVIADTWQPGGHEMFICKRIIK